MSVEENTAIVRRYIEEIWNRKNYAASADFIAPTCTINGLPLGGPEGANAWAVLTHGMDNGRAGGPIRSRIARSGLRPCSFAVSVIESKAA